MVGILLFAMLTFCTSVLFSFGGEEEVINTQSNLDTLQNDPYFQNLVAEEIQEKPSLDYLRKLAQAKKALEDSDLLLSLQRYIDLQREYGNYRAIIFGIAETYYQLADFSNALTYFALIIDGEDEKNTNLSKEVILARYRVANISYQLEETEAFIAELRYIIEQSIETEDALLFAMKNNSIDEVLTLFTTDLDFSYIARRELGVYLSYINEDINDEALVNLVAALSMAVNSFSQYLATQEVGYNFTDLFYMIELLRATRQGRELLFSFNINKILIGLRKYYNNSDDAYMEYMSEYCTQLLGLLGVYENEESNTLYVYYPAFQ